MASKNCSRWTFYYSISHTHTDRQIYTHTHIHTHKDIHRQIDTNTERQTNTDKIHLFKLWIKEF